MWKGYLLPTTEIESAMNMQEPMFPLLRIARHRLGIDGQGVTTLVAGASCPLRCKWCINQDILKRNAAEMISAQELYERVRGDDLYFRATGGGITFGGGESLLQAAFFAPFREICGDAWRLCAETSLAVPQSLVELAEQTIDEFIVDCKDMDPDIYHAYTGGDSSVMESNLRFLIEKAGPERVVVRVPLIPDFNTKEAQQNSIKHLQELGVTRLDVFNYVRRTASEK